MKIVGLITEYNPFHLGHRYHIEKAKELTGADYCVAVVSGNYVQRGEPSFIDKYAKTSVALENGVDLIIELPFCFATASAEYFAYATVSILDKLNCIDYICFGSECGDIGALKGIAEILCDEPEEFRNILKEQLRMGVSFPVARNSALRCYCNHSVSDELLNSPNNILGIEYIKALKKRASKILPVTYSRINASYHAKENENMMYSASAIRANYNSNNKILNCLPENCFPIFPDDFSQVMGMKLITYRLQRISHKQSKNQCTTSTEASVAGASKVRTINDIFGISDSLANRIEKLSNEYMVFSEFISAVKTKDISYTAVSRALIHILLDIDSHFIDELMNNDICDFIRVLGITNKGTELLNIIKTDSCLSIITNASDAKNILSSLPAFNMQLFDKWLYADELYRMVCMSKYGVNIPNEFTRKFLVSKSAL